MQLDMSHGTLASRFFQVKSLLRDGEGQHNFIDAKRWMDAEHIKAAVDPMSVANSAALAPKVGRDFVAMVRPATLLGRMAGIRRVPFITRTIVQTAGPVAQWVSEYGMKPVTAMSFEEVTALPVRKVAALSVITQELARAIDRLSGTATIAGAGSDVGENELVRDLGDAAVTAMDLAFIDFDNAGEVGERPASITYGQPTFTSSGSDAESAREDFRVMARNYRGNWRSAVLVMDSITAVALAQMPAALGGGSIDSANGTGVVFGVPALITDAHPYDSNGGYMSLIDASGVQVAGLLDAELKTTQEAAILMSDTPSEGAANLVSLYQTNSIAQLAEVFVNWQAVRSEVAVSIIDITYEV